uniref:AAA+ ATPase domain-containing protein n=1 Tax=Tetranychus urticae TaxID=32264 RepID=T1K9J1_TETUR
MSESASNLRRESVDLITSQLSQSLADSIEEAVNKSNNHFEFIPEIIRESHSCMCNTRKLMSILGQDSVSSERQNAGEPIVASRPADANIQSSSSTPVAPGSSSSSSSISIAHSIASGSSCYTDPCSPLETIRLLMKTASQEKSVLTGQRHRPIIVVGPAGVGKSSLLSQVYTYCSEWLSADSQVIKVVRHIGQSPSSSYTSELIRSLCIDITLVYGFEMRTDIVYELSSLSLWFHDLLKQIETTCPTNDLVIVLDDLHLLKSLQTSTILGWLPWTLPPSVHLICSVTEESDAVVSLLKSRIPSDNVIKLTPLESTAKILSMILCRLRGYTSIVDQQSDTLDQPSSKPNETLLPEKVWHLLSERFNAIVKTNPVTPLYVSLLTDTLLVPLICTPNSSEPSTRPSNLPGQEVTPSSGSSHATDSTSQTTEVNLKMTDIPITIDELIEKTVDELQKSFPCSTIDRLLTYLSGTRYGLREEELIDLIGNGDETGNNNKHDSDRKQSTCESENDSSDKNNETCSNVKEDNNLLSSLHQFESNSIWPAIKAKLNPFLKEYFILGRPYIHWSHRIICETIKQRYIVDTFDYKTIHSKLADAFLLGFNEAKNFYS